MKKSLFVLFLYSSLLTASEIAYRFVFGIETLPAAKMAETFALTFVIAALYLFARYKTSRLLIALFFAFSIIANNVHYAVYQSWMTGINYWLMLKEVTEVGSAGASMLDKLWLPALWGVLEVMLFCSLAKFRRKTHFSADILFAFLMLMIFVRSFDTKNEMAILNLIGKKWIDHLIQPTQLGYGNGDNMPDEKLLPLFDKINLQQGRHFIVLHQRGSHAPYGALLQPQDKVFGEADIVDKYDNTIHKTDQMIQTVFEQLQKQPDGNWLFAYTSDHGQYVRQDIYNQGTVQPDSYIVPLVLYSPDKAVQQAANQAFAPCEIAFHQQLSTFLIHTLGYDMPVSGCREGSVTGNLITGDAGSLSIRDGKAEYVYPQ